ncbi:DNA cytosine methyltransferase [Azospirillum sp. ST 5-10]|uniref:DNA cytosine methyltransferase n=1 Tax=unclassified Azospirillum TaxID=2630922 RepID=UPI003F4A223C
MVESEIRGGRRWRTAVDLYSGSGAVTAALKRRRFRVVAAVDSDPVACRTYRLNHPRIRMIQDDIRRVDPADIRERDLGGKDLDLLVVCAPCQPFSSQNRKRGHDDRSQLILQAGRFAEVLKPRLIFFENVPGLAAHASLLAELREALGPQYVLGEPQRIDAADYGVPQRRVRCIMLAARGVAPPELPPPITPKGKRVSVQQAIGHLRSLKAGEKDADDVLHAARHHQEIALRRLAAIPKNGGSRSSLPPELELACHVGVGKQKFSDVYGRMRWNDVAPTLTTGCTDITRGRFAHPEDDRAITPREASLLQTFPPDYRFTGTSSDIQTQIGNAVPVKLVEALVPTFRLAFAEGVR